MKAKYLIQLQTNNANMGATGWFSLDGAMTKTAANEKASDFRHARPVNDTRAVRVISAEKFAAEIREHNRAAFNHARIGPDLSNPEALAWLRAFIAV
jgi:hypothetical protein